MALDSIQILFRSLKKNKGKIIFGVVGLSISFSISYLVILISQVEFGYNSKIPNHENIYRIYSEYKTEKSTQRYRGTYPDAINEISSIAEIETSTRFFNWVQISGTKENLNSKEFSTGNFIFCDSNYFKVFPIYEWLIGNPKTALSKPFSTVITKSQAKKYFGLMPITEIIGKEVLYQDSLVFQVTAIINDLTIPTDLNFTDFLSFSSLNSLGKKSPIDLEDNKTINNDLQIYILKYNESSELTLNKKLSKSLLYSEKNSNINLKLQSLNDLHFDNELGISSFISRKSISKNTLYYLIIISGSILFLTAINFINLQIAYSFSKSKEIAIRRLVGGTKLNLIFRYIVENLTIAFIAEILSLVLATIYLYWFRNYLPQEVIENFINISTLIYFTLLTLLISIITSAFPLFILLNIKPINLVAKNMYSGFSVKKGISLQYFLTVIQFSIASGMVIFAIIISFQINFINNKDKGFESRNIFVFNPDMEHDFEKLNSIKELLKQKYGGDIESISLQSQPPGGGTGTNSIFIEFQKDQKSVFEKWINTKYGDKDYLTTYKLSLIEGRDFRFEDINKIIINRQLLHELGFFNPKDILGTILNDKEVIGVVEDFHYESIHYPIRGVAVSYDKEKLNTIAVKINGDKFINKAAKDNFLKKLENDVNIFINKNQEFMFYSLDERINDQYTMERNMVRLINLVTFVALALSCMGIFALSSLQIVKGTKSISLKKVFGASNQILLLSFLKRYFILTIISFLSILPVAVWLSEFWLSRFEYKIQIDFSLMLISFTFSLLFSFLSVSYNLKKIINTDPAQNLRHE